MRREENIISYVITRSRNSCLITFLKNTEAVTGGVEAVTGAVLKKRCS